MKVDQSMITGESEPVESVVNAADPNALEARNIIFNGSLGERRPLEQESSSTAAEWHCYYAEGYSCLSSPVS